MQRGLAKKLIETESISAAKTSEDEADLDPYGSRVPSHPNFHHHLPSLLFPSSFALTVSHQEGRADPPAPSSSLPATFLGLGPSLSRRTKLAAFLLRSPSLAISSPSQSFQDVLDSLPLSEGYLCESLIRTQPSEVVLVAGSRAVRLKGKEGNVGEESALAPRAETEIALHEPFEGSGMVLIL